MLQSFGDVKLSRTATEFYQNFSYLRPMKLLQQEERRVDRDVQVD